MSIKILGLNCSPRDKSNSNAVLDVSFKNIEEKIKDNVETEIIDLKDYDIQHCRACAVCGKKKDTGEFIDCVFDDDMSNIIAPKMLEADGIAVATPVYFGLPSDLFSKFIMRTRYLRHHDFALSETVVGVIAIAGRRSGGAETTIISTWLPFIRNGCIIVGNGDKTCQFGTMGWAGPPGQILTDDWGVEQAKDTVERIYNIANVIKAGKEKLDYKNPMKFSYSSGTR